MRAAVTVLLSAVGLFGPFQPAARAWNDAGHMAVALMAYRQLPDGIRVKLIKSLEKHPHFNIYLAADLPPGVDRNEWVVARAATWPDRVRPESRPPLPDHDRYHHGEWHFIDNPFVPPGQAGINAADLRPHPPHALSALHECLTKLKAPATDEQGRAVCLCWVLHLVGDIHQPLHAASLFTAQFPPPAGDRGGNFFFVPNSRQAPNLHYYWDSLLGEDRHFQAVSLTVDDLLHLQTYSRQALRADLQRREFEDWIEESFRLAVSLVYRGGDLKGLFVDGYHHHSGGSVPALTPDYEQSARKAALRRGALAGHRLADALTDLFRE
jgi:hypothetical protein